MNDGPIVRRISFDIHGEFITQLAREWFYTGEKSHEKVIEILMDSMTGTDTPEAQNGKVQRRHRRSRRLSDKKRMGALA